MKKEAIFTQGRLDEMRDKFQQTLAEVKEHRSTIAELRDDKLRQAAVFRQRLVTQEEATAAEGHKVSTATGQVLSLKEQVRKVQVQNRDLKT